jgi:hypothetical protein
LHAEANMAQPLPPTTAIQKPPTGLIVLSAVTLVLMLAALYTIFVMAPVELQMGIVQKIF